LINLPSRLIKACLENIVTNSRKLRDFLHVGGEDRLRLGFGDLVAAGDPGVGLLVAVAGDHHADLLVAEAPLLRLAAALAGFPPHDAAVPFSE
jgi:hypothetical protein